MKTQLRFLLRTASVNLFFLLVTLTYLLTIHPMYAQETRPVLEFPEPDLDDPTIYGGYHTRFYRDSDGNTIQISLNDKTGRVVNVLANGANESIAFTARTPKGEPAMLRCDGQSGHTRSERNTRYLRYQLSSDSPSLHLGMFLLGSMRKERDFQYHQKHLEDFSTPPIFPEEELIQLLQSLDKLPDAEKGKHLSALNANRLEDLRARLAPKVTIQQLGNEWSVHVVQLTFDGKNQLSLTLRFVGNDLSITASDEKVSITRQSSEPIRFSVEIGTDAPPLKPLTYDQIFNSDFKNYYERQQSEYRKLREKSARERLTGNDSLRLRSFRKLNRQVRGLELLSYEEKLMAGLPNFATYFGRDMMMSALMMERIWNPAMLEHVIGSVLRKLSPGGEVSHEESLGGQAIRENASRYNRLMGERVRALAEDQPEIVLAGNKRRVDSLLAAAHSVLRDLQSTQENHMMMDDDFQLSVLTARYLANKSIPTERKRAFLESAAEHGRNDPRIIRLLKNLVYVSRVSHPYVNDASPRNLVAFPRLDEEHWFPGSWRDSRAGYANGRYAMDINAIWVPNALESMKSILIVLGELGYSKEELFSLLPEIHGSVLGEYMRNPSTFAEAIRTWRRAIEHFRVRVISHEIHDRETARMAWMQPEERTYWTNVFERARIDADTLEFLALSLDSNGKVIAVANTDPVTLLFLEDFSSAIERGEMSPSDAMKLIEILTTPYPVGLFVDNLGLLVANDAYAPPTVWETFRKDHYHSPKVVWGREVNLFFLGAANQIITASKIENEKAVKTYVEHLRQMLEKVLAAVEASGLKHNELWTYRIDQGELYPARYASTSDIQLWNLTTLAVDFMLAELPAR